MNKKIIVLIATSMDRTDLLFSRSLNSVINQSRTPDAILIVDDNEDKDVSADIQERLSHSELFSKVPIIYLQNKRTHGFSGTGAWNTGIHYIAENFGEDSFIAILDDDDSWDLDYLEKCESQIEDDTQAVFAFIARSDCGLLQFSIHDLTIRNFLVGDPGIQGSNMFFRTDALLSIEGFDESLHSCTDRDLMIRFLSKYSTCHVKIIPQKLVNYFSSAATVSSIRGRKNSGLVSFFKKHMGRYNRETLNHALTRARNLFHFDQSEHVEELFQESLNNKSREVIAIGVAMHNDMASIGRCVRSILNQEGSTRKIQVVILDDNSTDQWNDVLKNFENDSRIQIFHTVNNNVSATRNQLNTIIKETIPNLAFIGRLDADDEICHNHVIAEIERIYDETNANVIIAGNQLRKDGITIPRVNKASKELLNPEHLLNRLHQMSEGNKEAELPSCNLFLKPNAVRDYPDIRSAEDHALLVNYLLDHSRINIQIAEDILYCIYNLCGQQTQSNKNNNRYLASRSLIYEEAKKMKKEKRIIEAREILEAYGIPNLNYLGQGQDGVVFHNHTSVYKVIMPFYPGKDSMEIRRHLSYFQNITPNESFYRLDEIIDFNGHLIEKYPYEISEPVFNYSEEEAINFLSDCWSAKVIVQDCKPLNFIRINYHIKLIDLDGCSYYSDNLFYNMCVRMFLYTRYFETMDPCEFRKVTRSAINNFDIPQLEGAREFVNKVFQTVICKESNSYFAANHKAITEVPQLVPLPEKVSLLIKTCGQDHETIKANIRHIVKQLSFPNPFYEVILSIDRKEGNFLRGFNKGSLNKVLQIAKKLQTEGIIDRYFLYDNSATAEINKKWFDIECEESHSAKNVPVASQLYAFEQCQGDYILQMDSDVLIGRKDRNHSFLRDMIQELQKNPKVLSVGFNIYNPHSKEYFGFEDGGFVPEVRFCLFDRQRLLDSRPWPNNVVTNGKLELSWYRSLEKMQKQTGLCSIRGGDNRSFFIHPQNYRKTSPYSWMYILDRVEQGYIPDFQLEKWDCEGSLYDWCNPKRHEKMIVVSSFRNVSPERFLRMWASLMSQNFKDFGVLLHDDCSDNGLPDYIEQLIAPYKEKVTFIKGRTKQEKMQSLYLMIHNFIDNPQSVIVCLDADDALIGKDTLMNVWKKYDLWGTDVVVGRVHQTYRLQANYRYPVNFTNPRESGGGNVWQHLKTFRKYLFDSIPLSYFKHPNKEEKLSHSRWIERCDDFAMMIPIIEMSKSPYQMDFVNYYYERDYDSRNDFRELKDKCIKDILDKPKLSPSDAFVGYKNFIPNTNKIELDITYDCNLKCKGCNRSCGKAPSKECMTLEQIETFIQESIDCGKKWTLINILGGEPTLHPNFLKIVEVIQTKYVDVFSPDTIVQIVCNGIAPRSRELCEQAEHFKNVRIDRNSFKTSNVVDYFSPFNDAPIDDPKFKDADFSKGCWNCAYCGIGLNKSGYYACAVCGGIERVLSTSLGIKKLEDVTTPKLKEQLNFFCKFCGNYKAYAKNAGEFMPRCEKEPFREIISPTWEEIYREYKDKN